MKYPREYDRISNILLNGEYLRLTPEASCKQVLVANNAADMPVAVDCVLPNVCDTVIDDWSSLYIHIH